MKTVQGGLLVALGLGILWLAVTGRLDRIGTALGWAFSNKDEFGFEPRVKPSSGPAPQPGGTIRLSSFGRGLPGALQRAFS